MEFETALRSCERGIFQWSIEHGGVSEAVRDLLEAARGSVVDAGELKRK